ncbi:hypothetical protein Csa_022244 [Cucumis sativus]|uniref:2OG-Fe(II) oxygenase n=1 Tax=Cucumis sativus TaxID=3659 RepID=A0A0A0LQU0_CUCSA|nr:hypothetical protein Csa_022244 [Cucumis sativus]
MQNRELNEPKWRLHSSENSQIQRTDSSQASEPTSPELAERTTSPLQKPDPNPPLIFLDSTSPSQQQTNRETIRNISKAMEAKVLIAVKKRTKLWWRDDLES